MKKNRQQKLYYIETGLGAGIRLSSSEINAEKEALKEAGTFAGVSVVRLATKKDIVSVKAMGGYIPNIKRGY